MAMLDHLTAAAWLVGLGWSQGSPGVCGGLGVVVEVGEVGVLGVGEVVHPVLDYLGVKI